MAEDRNDTRGLDADDVQFLAEVYPDAGAFLAFRAKDVLETAKDSIISLDANVLLLPYKMENRYFEKVIGLYSLLAQSKRLKISGQALREYFKHRTRRIADIYKYLEQEAGRGKALNKTISLLKDNSDYAEALQIAKQMDLLQSSLKQRLEKVQSSLKQVDSDVILTAYRECLVDCVIDIEFTPDSKKKFLDDLQQRYATKRPPGYKDGGKSDAGYGDLLIWKTLLSNADIKGKDLLFVTGEQKPDWFVRESGAPFQLRPELLDEYRRASNGGTVNVVNLSEFLKLFGADRDVISNAEQAQVQNTKDAQVYLYSELSKEVARLKNAIQHYKNEANTVMQLFGPLIDPEEEAASIIRALDVQMEAAEVALAPLERALIEKRYVHDTLF